MTDKEFINKLESLVSKGMLLVYDEEHDTLKCVVDFNTNGTTVELIVELWENSDAI